MVDYLHQGRPYLSFVAPCFNEEQSILEFQRRVSESCNQSEISSYEVVLVDDGSTDRTWQIIEDLSRRDDHVVGVRLFRNHGHQLAATAGLSISRGERVMLIDADLQDPPELLSSMMSAMDQGADVVYAKRRTRAGEGAFKLLTAWLFYRLLSWLTDVAIPSDTGDFRLMTRQIVDTLTLMPERHRFIRGMVSWIGGNQVAIDYDRHSRFAGSSKYPFRKMLRFAVDAITSFSTKPLRLAIWLGISVSGLAFLLLAYAVFQWAHASVVPGWASSLVSTSLFAGTQLLVLGIIGEYLGRVVEDLKQRPLFMVDVIQLHGKTYAVPAEFSRFGPLQQRDVIGTLTSLNAVDRGSMVNTKKSVDA